MLGPLWLKSPFCGHSRYKSRVTLKFFQTQVENVNSHHGSLVHQSKFSSGVQNSGLPQRLSSTESACSAGDPGLIPGWGRSPEEGTATYSSLLAWRVPCTEEPRGLQSMGSHGAGRELEWLSSTAYEVWAFAVLSPTWLCLHFTPVPSFESLSSHLDF